MKKFFLLFSLLPLLGSCLSIHVGDGESIRCKGPVVEKDLELAGFNAIVANGHSDLTVIQSDTFGVQVKANEEVFEFLDYHVEDGVLILRNKNNTILLAETMEVTVSLPTLVSLTVNGAADLKLPGKYVSGQPVSLTVNGAGELDIESMAVPALKVMLNGAGDLDVSGLDVEQLDVMVNGAGDITLSGRATKANLSVHGAGDVDARKLEYVEISKNCAGFASIKL